MIVTENVANVAVVGLHPTGAIFAAVHCFHRVSSMYSWTKERGSVGYRKSIKRENIRSKVVKGEYWMAEILESNNEK